MQGPAFVDIDGDGDLDLVIGDVSGIPMRVYKNLVGQEQNFLRIKLIGKGAGGANVFDHSKFERAFGETPVTPHREGVKATVKWFREHPQK